VLAAVDGIDVLHIGASDSSTEMGIPGQYTHERMRAAFETVARDPSTTKLYDQRGYNPEKAASFFCYARAGRAR
jgi:hypothetical protein